MRLDELADDPIKKAVFTFGRLNPPHYGHGGMIDTLQKVAKQSNADWYLFVSSKTGDEKNPLTYEQKVEWIYALFPETKGHLVVDSSIKTPLVAATWLYKQGYRAATFVAGEDDMSSYGEMIKSGNVHGMKNPDAVKAGKGYIFKPLDFAISPRLASATNARKNVTDGDPEAFVRSILGPKINPKLAALVQNKLYPTLRKSLNLESVNEDFDSDAEEHRAFMLRPENQKDTVISKAIKDYTPLGDMAKVGSAINRGDYKAAILPAASLATNAIPGKPIIGMAAGAALGVANTIAKANESENLNKSTPSVMDLAKKYMTDPAEVHRQLAKGVKIEFEHTDDIDVATEIAMDHLGERLDYYSKLAKLENESEEDDNDDFGIKVAQALGGTAGAIAGVELGPFGAALTGLGGAELGKKAYKAAKPYVKSSSNAAADYSNRVMKKLGLKEIEDDAVAIPGEPISAALSRMNARSDDQSKADFLGSYMKSALDKGGFTNDKFAQHTANLKKKIGENFADGKGPGKPGDSQRHGIPKGATIAQLEKAAKASGRKGQLARWQLNMRRGKKKHNVNESVNGKDMLKLFTKQHWDKNWNNPKMYQFILDHDWGIKMIQPDQIPSEEALWDRDDPFDRVIEIDNDAVKQHAAAIKQGSTKPIIMGPDNSVIDGNHRAQAAKLLNVPIQAYVPMEKIEETLKKVNGKWALVSRHDPEKVLQYYHGSGHPSKEWVSKVERRVHSFESEVDEVAKVKLSTDPADYGAYVRDAGGPEKITTIPFNKIVSTFEPEEFGKMKLPKSAANVERIIAGIKRGDKLPPLLVRRYKNGYQVLDGHHRYEAYKRMRIKEIPVRVVDPKNITEAIDDSWFKTDSFETYKKANPVKYQTATTAGTIQTLEGPVKYEAGYKIITGPKGEQYPIPPEKFAELYDVDKSGIATPKKIIKVAKLADHDGVVNTSWGEPLNYTAGNDYIVRHGANDYGVVKKDIFAKTYVQENTTTEDYRDAARYAAQAHSGQKRSGGKPYISHPVRVANLVKKYKDSKELDKLLSAAFLHDTIEDTDTTEEQLRKMFGDLVASLVKELTSDKDKIEKLGKAEYLTQKMIHMSSWGLVIKLADRLDNVADIKTAKTPEWRHRYRAETENILTQLEQNRKLSGTHQAIIADIRDKLAEIDESATNNNTLRYDVYSGISFPDGPIYFSSHLGERLIQRKADLILVQELLLKAKKEHGNKISGYDFDNSFVIKKKSGPGLGVDKKQQPDSSIRYRVRTYHPDKNVGYIQDRVYVSEEAETAQPLVYIDMDGVLADFFGEWSRISGVNHYKDIDDVPAKLELIRNHPTFWIDLPLLPHAKALIKTVVDQFGEYRICSTPLTGDERSKPGKVQWIRTHLSDIPPAEIILTHDKSQFAFNNNQPNILIDDFGKNINAWRAAGGIGIKYEDANFADVAKILEKLSKN